MALSKKTRIKKVDDAHKEHKGNTIMCVIRFSKQRDQNSRKEENEPKKHGCNLCEFSTTNRGRLVDHLWVRHMNGTRWKCDKCNYATSHRTSMSEHLAFHAGEETRRFQRAECDYRAKNRVKLDAHSNIHTGAKRVTCPVCSKSISDKWN